MRRILAENIHKKFKIGFKKRLGVLSRITNTWIEREHRRESIILHNVSFEVGSGEILGIIGSNGSGKSTLLRIIAGIYKPSSGNVKADGKITSIINLGIGLKERLTMRDNIFLVGSLFGMSRGKIKQSFDSIVEFSELKDFTETKIYQFSAGMIQRLAFSIAVHSHPDILLLDEVFEVGDESFRKKSAQKIQELARGGACVIFVTHDLDMIKRQCHRVIWLSEGKIKMQGKPEEVTAQYVLV